MMEWVFSAIEQKPSFKYYQPQLDLIIESVDKNPALAIELCKSTIESFCKTLLNDREIPINSNTSFPNLIKQTLNCFPFILNSNESINKTHAEELVDRLSNTISYIGTIRNKCNFASHGQDINHPKIDKALSNLVVRATNALLGFLIHLDINYPNHTNHSRFRYEDFKEFNQYIDEKFSELLGLHELDISISEALFHQDRIAYRDRYLAYQNDCKLTERNSQT